MPPHNSGYTWSIYVHFAADARAESFSEVWRSWSSSSALNYGDLNKANHPLKFETYWNMSVCQKWVRQTKDKDVQSKAIHPLFCALFKTNCWVFFLSIFDHLSVIKLLKLSFKQQIWICRCYFDMPDVVFRKIHNVYSTKIYALSKKKIGRWLDVNHKKRDQSGFFTGSWASLVVRRGDTWCASPPCGAMGCIVFCILAEASWEYRKDFRAILCSFNK